MCLPSTSCNSHCTSRFPFLSLSHSFFLSFFLFLSLCLFVSIFLFPFLSLFFLSHAFFLPLSPFLSLSYTPSRFKLWHYRQGLVHAQGVKELWEVCWVPASAGTYPERSLSPAPALPAVGAAPAGACMCVLCVVCF